MTVAERTCSGVLELQGKGHGFLRNPARNFKAAQTDAYVGSALLAQFQLRQGVYLTGRTESARQGEGPRVAELLEIEGHAPEQYLNLRLFDDLTAIDPRDRIRLETGPEPMGMRVMDLLTPIGKGQRGLIVAPPRTGKTILLQQTGRGGRDEPPRDAPARPADRRAARGGDRDAPERARAR